MTFSMLDKLLLKQADYDKPLCIGRDAIISKGYGVLDGVPDGVVVAHRLAKVIWTRDIGD